MASDFWFAVLLFAPLKRVAFVDLTDSKLVGCFMCFFNFHPYLGKISDLTSIFFRWVETSNQKKIHVIFFV